MKLIESPCAIISGLVLALTLPAQTHAVAEEPTRIVPKPLDLPDIICSWDLQEEAGQTRCARGPHDYQLEEREGPIGRAEDGVWGPYGANIAGGQWFRIRCEDCPALYCNPFVYPHKPIFDGGRDGADFTVAQRAVPHWKGYPDEPIERHVGFGGQLGGLAVYRRALTAEEISRIHRR